MSDKEPQWILAAERLPEPESKPIPEKLYQVLFVSRATGSVLTAVAAYTPFPATESGNPEWLEFGGWPLPGTVTHWYELRDDVDNVPQ